MAAFWTFIVNPVHVGSCLFQPVDLAVFSLPPTKLFFLHL